MADEREELNENNNDGIENESGNAGNREVNNSGNVDDEDILSVQIGEEAPTPEDDEADESAPEWVKKLRADQRVLRRENAEMKRKLEEKQQQAAPAPVQLGEKPTLASCEYDEEKFVTELDKWHDRKKEVDQRQANEAAALKKQQDNWNAKVNRYNTDKTTLKVKDFDAAESVVATTLSSMQQSIIVKTAKDPAMLIYAIGKNPKVAGDLAKIEDPIEFAFAVAEVQSKMKVNKGQRQPPEPERMLNGGSGNKSGGADKTLERLRAEAERTGDYTKVTSYKRQLKASAGKH